MPSSYVGKCHIKTLKQSAWPSVASFCDLFLPSLNALHKMTEKLLIWTHNSQMSCSNFECHVFKQLFFRFDLLIKYWPLSQKCAEVPRSITRGLSLIFSISTNRYRLNQNNFLFKLHNSTHITIDTNVRKKVPNFTVCSIEHLIFNIKIF